MTDVGAARSSAVVTLLLGGLGLGLLAGAALVSAACQPLPTCCSLDAECTEGARCFEGRCTLRCGDDSQCGEGEECLAPGICAAIGRAKSPCSFLYGGETFDTVRSDAGQSDIGRRGPDAGAPNTCAPDRFEPNDTPGEATRIFDTVFDTVEGLTLCAGDEDYFAIDAVAGDTVVASVAFRRADGDVGLELRFEGQPVAVSEGDGDVGQASHLAERSGVYFARVYGVGGRVDNRYSLALTRVPGSTPCADDAFEENDTVDEAAALRLEEPLEGVLCPTDTSDFFLLEAPSAGAYAFTLRYALGESMRLSVTTPDGVLRRSESGTSGDAVSVRLPEAGPVRVQVSGGAEAGARGYRLEALPGVSEACFDAYEPNTSLGEAPMLQAPALVYARLCEPEFFFLAPRPGEARLTLSLEGTVSGDVVSFTTGAELASLDAGESIEVDFQDEVPGEVFLRVWDESLDPVGYILELD